MFSPRSLSRSHSDSQPLNQSPPSSPVAQRIAEQRLSEPRAGESPRSSLLQTVSSVTSEIGRRYPNGHVLNEDALKKRLRTETYGVKDVKNKYFDKEVEILKSQERKSPTDIFFKDRPAYSNWGEEDLKTLPLRDIASKENEMIDTHVPLYHGQSLAHWANTQFINTFVQKAFSDPELTSKYWLRNPFDQPKVKFSSVEDRSRYLEGSGQQVGLSSGLTDNTPRMARELLSTNPSLMHNSDRKAEESTADYVYNNENVQRPSDTGTLASLFTQVGLAEKQATYTQKIDDLVKEHLSVENARGVLYQILIPHEEVRDLVYISRDNGIPDEKNPDALKTLLSMQIPCDDLNKQEELTNRQSLQARILMSPLMDPGRKTGVEIIPYFDKNPKVEEGIRNFSKAIDTMVDQLLVEIGNKYGQMPE